MNRTQLSLIITLSVLLITVWGCQDHSQDRAMAEENPPTVAVTHWTDSTELFMEYPVFVAGESGRSAIHVTDLSDFSPLTSGEAIVGLLGEDGQMFEFRGGVSRPGIFGVDLAMEKPGDYQMTLRVDAPGLQDLHELGMVTVHAAGAQLDGDEDEAEAISFLKEQQWTLEFGTEPVDVRSLQSSIQVPAVVQPRSGGQVLISAPVPGRIDSATAPPIPGTRVRKGALLAKIIPRSDDIRDAAGLRSALVQAEQEHELARQERDRAARLVEARALPSRRLNDAAASLAAAEARLEAAHQRIARFEALSQSGDGVPAGGAFAIRAPFDGSVDDVRFAPGASVEEDQFLLRIIDSDSVYIVGAVPESEVSTLESVKAGELLLSGSPPISLGKPIAVGKVVEPAARTVDVHFAFDNRDGSLRVGQSVGLRLLLGDEQARPAVPESAVVDDGGNPVVFVQSGGESFERRPVRLGSREGGYVHLLEGVEPGERVVHRGAYLIRLAAMSTQIPAHGHVH